MTARAATATEITHPEPFACAECGVGVTIERMPSGAAFTIVEQAGVPEGTTFGVGASGDPLCPKGHGEMLREVVDDADPGDVPADQGALFDLSQPFNYEGAWFEVERLTLAADELARIANEDKQRAAESRKQWESAAALVHKATIEYRRRRLAKLRQPAPVDDAPDAPDTDSADAERDR